MTSKRTSPPRRDYSPPPGARPLNKNSGEINFQLTKENASIEERRAGFALLQTLAARSSSLDRRQDYYDTIVTPVDHSIVDLQIGCLDTLTESGRVLAPFEAELTIFLNNQLKEVSTITELQREASRGNGPRTSVYESESPVRGSSKTSPPKEPAGAEKALLVSRLSLFSYDSLLNTCIIGSFLPDSEYHHLSSQRVPRRTIGNTTDYRHNYCKNNNYASCLTRCSQDFHCCHSEFKNSRYKPQVDYSGIVRDSRYSNCQVW